MVPHRAVQANTVRAAIVAVAMPTNRFTPMEEAGMAAANTMTMVMATMAVTMAIAAPTSMDGTQATSTFRLAFAGAQNVGPDAMIALAVRE